MMTALLDDYLMIICFDYLIDCLIDYCDYLFDYSISKNQQITQIMLSLFDDYFNYLMLELLII